MSAPSRPTTPYISLDDPQTKKFFTKYHIQNHLRRAGLLNKHGEILTQAEYDSQHKDVTIGRENRRKIDDIIMEVLEDMAREHWAHARDYTESVRSDLLKQFRRIERQYRRRTQPITIRYNSDGRLQLDSTKSLTDDHSDTKENAARPSTERLPRISAANRPPRPSSSHSRVIQQSTDLDTIRQELNNITTKLTNLEKALNVNSGKNEGDGGLRTVQQSLVNLEEHFRILNGKYEEQKQRIDEFYHQSKSHDGQTKLSEVHKQQTEHSNPQSTGLKELHDRLLILETSFRHRPTEQLHEATKISKNKTNDREGVTENLARDVDEKIKQIETQLAQVLTRLDRLPDDITYANDIQLIRNEIQNLQLTQQTNDERQNFARERIDKVNHLEKQLTQSNEHNIPHSTIEQPVKQSISKQQTVPQPNSNYEQRFKNPERRLNSIPLPADLSSIEQRLTQLENYPRNVNDHRIETLQEQIRDNFGHFQLLQGQMVDLNKRKLEQQEISPIIKDIEQRSQQERQKLHDLIMSHHETKPDYQKVNQRIQDGEGQTDQRINALHKSVKENQRAVKNMENYFNDLRQRLNQQPISIVADTSNSEEDSITNKPTSKELQAVMPFIELLPTFDMFNENEWI